MPTRKPTISESARLVSSAIRAAAASVSFITCGRGRGFALAGVVEAGVISVIYSVLAGHQSRLISRKQLKPKSSNASPHVENKTCLVGHAVGGPGRLPHDIDVDHTYAGNAG